MEYGAGNVEREAKLVVIEVETGRIFEELTRLNEIAGHALTPRSTRILNDVYFDTPDGRIRAAGWALRVRRHADECAVCLKGPGVKHGSIVSRVEIEGSAPEVGDPISAQLRELGVDFAISADETDPCRLIGVTPIQSRETVRRLMDAHTTAGSDDPPAVETALDTVTYTVGTTRIIHQEIELEALLDCLDMIEDIVRELLERYPRSIREWSYGKLTTGIALGKLFGKHEAVSKDAVRTLTREEYARVEETLRRG